MKLRSKREVKKVTDMLRLRLKGRLEGRDRHVGCRGGPKLKPFFAPSEDDSSSSHAFVTVLD